MSRWTGARSPSVGNNFWISLTVLRLFCYCHFVITGTWSMLSSQAFYPNMEDRSRASSNEFCRNHRMNQCLFRIIDWILLELSNEYWLNCLINEGENRMQIKVSNRMYWTKSNIFEQICEINKRTYTTSNIDTFRQAYTCSISTQRGQAIEFVDRPVPEKL